MTAKEIEEANKKPHAVRLTLQEAAAIRAIKANYIASLPTQRLAQPDSSKDKSASSFQDKDSQQEQIEKEKEIQNDATEKARAPKLETFLKINKDLLRTAGSPIERLFLHAASIAVFAIWLVADKLNQQKKIPVELKTDKNRANRQNFRGKTQTEAAKITGKQRPLVALQQKGADFLRGQGLGKGQAKVACRSK
jgi:hypothetical protein